MRERQRRREGKGGGREGEREGGKEGKKGEEIEGRCLSRKEGDREKI